MANSKPADSDAPENATESATEREYDPRNMVYVYDTQTGNKLSHPVPETWLDGRFPQLSETPSKKEGN